MLVCPLLFSASFRFLTSAGLFGFGTPISIACVNSSNNSKGMIPPVASLWPVAKSDPTRAKNSGEAFCAYPFSRSRRLGRSCSGSLRALLDSRQEKLIKFGSGLWPGLAHMTHTRLFAPLSVPDHRVAMTGCTWQGELMRKSATRPSLLNFGGVCVQRSISWLMRYCNPDQPRLMSTAAAHSTYPTIFQRLVAQHVARGFRGNQSFPGVFDCGNCFSCVPSLGSEQDQPLNSAVLRAVRTPQDELSSFGSAAHMTHEH